jgi:O-antigen/teichoic acid export membrane protein
VFNLYGGCLEAIQRFDLSTRSSIVSTTIRTFGTAVVLYLGYGLIAVGLVAAFSQIVMYVLNYVMFRRLFPTQGISFRHASKAMLRQMAGFGFHTFLSIIGGQISVQSAPVLIGHYWEARFVGYYNLPVKLLQYTVELVARIGLVTNSNAAELAARKESAALVRLAIFPNRYCLVAFMPLAIVLVTYGDRLLQLWVGAAFAAESAPVLPVLLAGSVIAHVGQFSSTMLLQGLARNKQYARSLLAEALVGILAMILVIPRYGILGCAIVTSVLMILNRGLFVSWLTAAVVNIPFWSYVSDIYLPPFLASVPVFALLFWMRTVVSGKSWLELAAAGLVAGTAYYAIAWFSCIAPQDRRLAWDMLIRRLAPLKKSVTNPG